MNEPEIILNLWYVHDAMGLIYSLRVRAYVGTGTDDQKLAFLLQFANLDYQIARVFPIPDRFHIEIEEDGERRRIPVAPKEYLNGLDSPIALFEDAIREIEADLPGQTKLTIGEAPLFNSTALLADDSGRLYSGRQMLRLSREEEVVDVAEPTWALVIAFLANHGWNPSVSLDSFLSGNGEMKRRDAVALAEAGQTVFAQALEDPLAVQIRFDLEKLAEIVDLAFGGGFKINR